MPSGDSGTKSDLELLDAWRSGDGRAGDEIVRRHYRTVYNFLLHKVDSERDDLAQQIFLGCLEGIDRLRSGGNFRAFLLGIARHRLVDFYRTRARAQRFDPGTVSIEAVAGATGGSVAVARREHAQALVASLRRLPLDLQLTVELFYWEDLSLVDIASITEIPIGTVKSRLARARDVLRRELACLGAGLEVVEDAAFDDWARSIQGSGRI